MVNKGDPAQEGGTGGTSPVAPPQASGVDIDELQREIEVLKKRHAGAMSARDKLATQMAEAEKKGQDREAELEASLSQTAAVAKQQAEQLQQLLDVSKRQTEQMAQLQASLKRAEAISQAGGKIIPEMVPATSDEKQLEAALDAAKKRYAEIETQVREDLRSQIVPGAQPPRIGATGFMAGMAPKDYILAGKTHEEREQRQREVSRWIEQQAATAQDDGGSLYTDPWTTHVPFRP